MSIVRMSYQCQCGAVIAIEDREIMAGSFALQSAVIDHEDETCK